MTLVTTPLTSGTKLYVVGDQNSIGYSEGVTLVDTSGNPITTSSGVPTTSTDVRATATFTAVGQSVQVNANASGSYSALIVPSTSPAWVGAVRLEGSHDGTIWIPSAARQTISGRIGNTIKDTDLVPSYSSTGQGALDSYAALMRGASGEFKFYRVVCTALSAGSVNITLAVGQGSPVTFPNTFVESRTLTEYYASGAGGHTLFSATTDVQSTTNSTTVPTNFAIMRNPASSTVDLVIANIRCQASVAGGVAVYLRRSRYITPGTIGAGFTSQPIANRGGGTNAGQGLFYAATATTAAYTGGSGILAESNIVSPYVAFEDDEIGASYLKPGQDLLWTVTPETATATKASFSVIYWEAATTI